MRNIRAHFSNLRCATILCDSCYYSASLTTFSMATCSETQFYPNVLRNTIGFLLGLFFLFVPFTATLQAQEDIQISSPDDVVVICDGFFYDDGALGAVDGGPTLTRIIRLQFVLKPLGTLFKLFFWPLIYRPMPIPTTMTSCMSLMGTIRVQKWWVQVPTIACLG